jgi:hypothetical protein
LGVAEVL